ncbi:MAG: hypothetical protein AAB588_03450 [Patescibacteria group bacterium]
MEKGFDFQHGTPGVPDLIAQRRAIEDRMRAALSVVRDSPDKAGGDRELANILLAEEDEVLGSGSFRISVILNYIMEEIGGPPHKVRNGVVRFLNFIDVTCPLRDRLGSIGSYYNRLPPATAEAFQDVVPEWMEKNMSEFLNLHPDGIDLNEYSSLCGRFVLPYFQRPGDSKDAKTLKLREQMDGILGKMLKKSREGKKGDPFLKIILFQTVMQALTQVVPIDDKELFKVRFRSFLMMLLNDDRVSPALLRELLAILTSYFPEGEEHPGRRNPSVFLYQEVVLLITEIIAIKIQKMTGDPIRAKEQELCAVVDSLDIQYLLSATVDPYRSSPLTALGGERVVGPAPIRALPDPTYCAGVIREMRDNGAFRDNQHFQQVESAVNACVRGEGDMSPRDRRAFLELLVAYTDDRYLEALSAGSLGADFAYTILRKVLVAQLDSLPGESPNIRINYHRGDRDGRVFNQRNFACTRAVVVGDDGAFDREGFIVWKRDHPDDLCGAEGDLPLIEAHRASLELVKAAFVTDLRTVTTAFEDFKLPSQEIPPETQVAYFEAKTDSASHGFLSFRMGMYERPFGGTIDRDWNMSFDPGVGNELLKLTAEISVLACLHTQYFVPLKVTVREPKPQDQAKEDAPEVSQADESKTRTPHPHEHQRGILVDLTERETKDVELVASTGDEKDKEVKKIYVRDEWKPVFPCVLNFYSEDLQTTLRTQLATYLGFIEAMDYIGLEEALARDDKKLSDFLSPEQEEEMHLVDLLLMHRNKIVRVFGPTQVELSEDKIAGMERVRDQIATAMERLGQKTIILPQIADRMSRKPGEEDEVLVPGIGKRLGEAEAERGVKIQPRPSARTTFVKGHYISQGVRVTAGQVRVVLNQSRDVYIGETALQQVGSMMQSWGIGTNARGAV